MTKQELIELKNKLLETYDEENSRQRDTLTDLDIQILEKEKEELRWKYAVVGTSYGTQKINEINEKIRKLKK